MPAEQPLLRLRDLSIAFPTARGVTFAARRVSLDLRTGQILGIVGESGSGKSVTCRAAIGMLKPPGEVVGGTIQFDDTDLTQAGPRRWRRYRGREIGMIFQESSTAMDPLRSVGSQLSEVLRTVGRLSPRAARKHAVELLSRYHAYPHQLSGGMRQRVAIALALAPKPRVLLADEPTTALDVTVQSEILSLLRSIQSRTAMAMALVSHDFGVIAQTAHRVAVMYGGYVVEEGPVDAVLHRPRHPYTAALLSSLIPLGHHSTNHRVQAIRGQPPTPEQAPAGCPFQPRCAHARPSCAEVPMALEPAGPDQLSACPFAASGEISL
jgi:oligopeptide/dipeptide ABC transporter ATP-binding protein